jgi:hypothetical protein
LDNFAFLIACVIQKQRDGFLGMLRRQFPKQVANTECVNIGIVGDRDYLMGDGIERPKYIKSLSTRV